jgi:hypothetical protein
MISDIIHLTLGEGRMERRPMRLSIVTSNIYPTNERADAILR